MREHCRACGFRHRPSDCHKEGEKSAMEVVPRCLEHLPQPSQPLDDPTAVAKWERRSEFGSRLDLGWVVLKVERYLLCKKWSVELTHPGVTMDPTCPDMTKPYGEGNKPTLFDTEADAQAWAERYAAKTIASMLISLGRQAAAPAPRPQDRVVDLLVELRELALAEWPPGYHRTEVDGLWNGAIAAIEIGEEGTAGPKLKKARDLVLGLRLLSSLCHAEHHALTLVYEFEALAGSARQAATFVECGKQGSS